jgi:SAM-dependent methyltransferase
MAIALDQTISAQQRAPATGVLRWMPYRLFPYERRMGLRELEGLGLTVIAEQQDAVVVSGDVARALQRATYFCEVEGSAGERIPTRQHRVESAHLERRSRAASRQATRYGLHGVHEYKGKFNPQLARALCNVVDPTAELLFDPFCGSGTALLEGLGLGLDVVGIDPSPMAWFIASVKLAAANAADKLRLQRAVLRLSRPVADALQAARRRSSACDLQPALGRSAVEYLEGWFAEDVFCSLKAGLCTLYAAPRSIARDLCALAFSSILRSVSLQMPEDLRIRRRREPFEAPSAAGAFLEAIAAICDGLAEMHDWTTPAAKTATVLRTAAADPCAYQRAGARKRRLILTSPPYATALPYIDTDRLSIVVLGLAEPSELAILERGLLGSREWLRAEQKLWEDRRAANTDRLPASVVGLLDRIQTMNAGGKAGFRRLALPSLLYRYFAGMGEAMSTWLQVLEPGESAVLIVGHNRTRAGGEPIDIPTPELLGEIAISRGFGVSDLIGLETWPRYGLHSANGVPGEDALVITPAR